MTRIGILLICAALMPLVGCDRAISPAPEPTPEPAPEVVTPLPAEAAPVLRGGRWFAAGQSPGDRSPYGMFDGQSLCFLVLPTGIVLLQSATAAVSAGYHETAISKIVDAWAVTPLWFASLSNPTTEFRVIKATRDSVEFLVTPTGHAGAWYEFGFAGGRHLLRSSVAQDRSLDLTPGCRGGIGESAVTFAVRQAVKFSGGVLPATPDEEKLVRVYNWSDYIDPTTLEQFTAETGILVNYDVFDSNELLETRLLDGETGYDVVVPSASFLERQVGSGLFLKLDRALLPNWQHLDPRILELTALHDPDNAHSVTYMWGTTVLAFDESRIAALVPDAPLDSWSLLFNPAIVSRLADCGVSVLDAPTEMVALALAWFRRDPNSEQEADLASAIEVLMNIRPYVRMVHSSDYIEALAKGEICLAVAWSGDALHARDLALQGGRGDVVRFAVPKEGTTAWFDVFAIPADAPHPGNAHTFINFMMRPDIAAKNSNYINYASGNMVAPTLLDAAVRDDPAVYPPSAVKARLFPDLGKSDPFVQLLDVEWARFVNHR